MIEKLARDLVPGDVIFDEGTFPRALYAGVVKMTDLVYGGSVVHITLTDGGFYLRPSDHRFIVDTAEAA